MKKFFVAIFATLALFAGAVQAANPQLVVGDNVVRGTAQALSVEKYTAGGSYVTQVRYSSGFQYVQDDASWTKYAAVVAGMGANAVAAPGSSTGRVYNPTLSNGVYCQSSNSVISWSNVNQPDYLADGCQFHQAVKAIAN